MKEENGALATEGEGIVKQLEKMRNIAFEYNVQRIVRFHTK
jgi:hypothetical protein